jgi:hypothetical protein
MDKSIRRKKRANVLLKWRTPLITKEKKHRHLQLQTCVVVLSVPRLDVLFLFCVGVLLTRSNPFHVMQTGRFNPGRAFRPATSVISQSNALDPLAARPAEDGVYAFAVTREREAEKQRAAEKALARIHREAEEKMKKTYSHAKRNKGGKPRDATAASSDLDVRGIDFDIAEAEDDVQPMDTASVQSNDRYGVTGAAAGAAAPAAAAAAAAAAAPAVDFDHAADLAGLDDGDGGSESDDDSKQPKRMRITKVIHVKSTPKLRAFQLPVPHAYLVDMDPHFRALYKFIRKLAGCEPYNPAARTNTYLPQLVEDRMMALWITTPGSLEYIESVRLQKKYKDDLATFLARESIEGESEAAHERAKLHVIRMFKDHFVANMRCLVQGAACASIQNAHSQLRRTRGADIAKLSLASLLLSEELTDVFVHVVNVHLQLAAAAAMYRGISDAQSARLLETNQSRLDVLVNAKKEVQADGSIRWRFRV